MLADILNKIASNSPGWQQGTVEHSASFATFVRERATEMAINGHKSMAFSMNESLWGLDSIKLTFLILEKDGFKTGIIEKASKLDDGRDAVEFIITIEWK